MIMRRDDAVVQTSNYDLLELLSTFRQIRHCCMLII